MSTKINHFMATVALVTVAGLGAMSAGVLDHSGSPGADDPTNPPVAKVRMADAGTVHGLSRRG